MLIEIPFNDWSKHRILFGKKRATSRFKKYGKRGDTFRCLKNVYEIAAVERYSLGTVYTQLWEIEGAESESELRQVFKAIHPKRHTDNLFVWVHFFEKQEGVLFA